MPSGTLRVYVTVAGGNAPLAGAAVNVFDATGNLAAGLATDASGATEDLLLPAPEKRFSLDENNTDTLPYAVYDIAVTAPAWQGVTLTGAQLFEAETTVARVSLLPADEAVGAGVEEEIVIPPHGLFFGTGSGNTASGPGTVCAQDASEPLASPAKEELPAAQNPGSTLVLEEVIVPKKITVHLGKPSANASNVSVSFQNYIANVASSEVYPTWPRQALRANILAQISLALNRIYTEWYPSRGYAFNISNSPGYDQAYVQGRTVFAVMEELTAELFSTYVRRSGNMEPYFTEYCDGKTVTCAGMKQWGTVTRANEGLNALQILRYYYGNTVQLITTNNLQSIPQSYPGNPLRLGSSGTAVSIVQKQLSRIAKDYPSFGKPEITGSFDAATQSSVRAFQRQFSLTVDGVVGRATWYKISYIYVSVKDLAELTSEGEALSGVQSAGTWPGTVLRSGATGRAVEQVQFWLQSLAQFDGALRPITVDGNYGSATAAAVQAFQTSAGLSADGVVGETTWNALYEQWVAQQSDAGGTAWPGTVLRSGSRGNGVRLVQFWLRIAADNDTALSPVTVDGSYGSGTAAAVRAFQTRFGLSADGVVGRDTWAKMNEVSLAVTNELIAPNGTPGTYPGVLREGSSGTSVRALQYYLRLLAAYYNGQPTVTVDGRFGAATTNAVRIWQTRADLTADGVVGALTWQSIYTAAVSISASGPVAVQAAVPAFDSALVLAAGDSGEQVDDLRRVLTFLAQWQPEIQQPGEASEFDETLAESVKSAQRAYNLPETGAVSAADWAALQAAARTLTAATPGTPTPEPGGVWPGYTLALGSVGPAVLAVQQWLNALAAVRCELSFVPETGVLDSDTQQALEAYQISAGLSPVGVVDLATWSALSAAAPTQDA